LENGNVFEQSLDFNRKSQFAAATVYGKQDMQELLGQILLLGRLQRQQYAV
jgi:hypothetical protein